MRKYVWLAVLAGLLVPGVSRAQAGPITSYTLKFYQQGATAPTQQEVFAAANVVCAQVPLPSNLSTVNPTRATWSDPNSTTGQVCIYVEPTTGPLYSLPLGNFEGTLTASNDVGPSVESARAPFSRASVPPAPTGFRFIR